MLRRFWLDDCGGVVSPELVLVATILVVGIVVGLATLRTALHEGLENIGAAVESVDFTPQLAPSGDPATASFPASSTSSVPLTAADLP